MPHDQEHALDSTDHTGTINDTQHGSRGGAGLHPAATGSVAGFMAAADKTKLDSIVSGDPFLKAYFFDDFWPPVLDDMWTTSTSGTGSTIALLEVQGGQVRIRAGNAATRSAELYFGGAPLGLTQASFNPRMKVRANCDGTVTNAEYWIELVWIDASNYIILRAATGGNWILETNNGGTLTQVDTGVALATGWKTFEIRAQTGQATAYIDGVLKATSTTNVPTGAGHTTLYVYAAGTGGTKNMLVDAFEFKCDREA